MDLRRSLDDGVLTVTIDDGAKNVLDPADIAALTVHLVADAGPSDG